MDAKIRQEKDYSKSLVAAVRAKRTNIVKLLLRHGADPNAKDDKRDTVLMIASRKKDVKTVQALLDGGADVNAIGGLGYTALMDASSGKGHEKIVEMLLDRGADASIVNNHGLIAMSRAFNTNIISMLYNARCGGGFMRSCDARKAKMREKGLLYCIRQSLIPYMFWR